MDDTYTLSLTALGQKGSVRATINSVQALLARFCFIKLLVPETIMPRTVLMD